MFSGLSWSASRLWPVLHSLGADHFVDINEMVGYRMAAVATGFAGLGDNGDEVGELGVFKPAIPAAEIVEDLEEALEEFCAVEQELKE